MRPSGVFSSWALSRKYGRDNASFEEKPNAVIFIEQPLGEDVDKIHKFCNDKQIPVQHLQMKINSLVPQMNQLMQNVKQNMKHYYVEKWGKQKYHEGVTEGKKSYFLCALSLCSR